MRLTDHLEKDSVFTCDEKTFIKCYKKLSLLEDWEGKLKINLNIILHALFYGFYGINNTGKIKKYDISNSDIYIHSTRILTCEDGYEFGDEFMFNECGKTWALTKEELL